MTSRAEKMRKHKVRMRQYAGRPKKEGVERYSNGEIKHFEREKEVRSVAIDALKRVHNVSYDTNGYSGYVLGRLYLDGRITEWEREAGDEYANWMAKFYGVVGYQFPSARAHSLFSISGFGAETSPERARMAREMSTRAMTLEGILLKRAYGPQIKSTVYNTCMLDLEIMRTMPEAQLQWLKAGLKEIHYFFGLAKSKEAV